MKKMRHVLTLLLCLGAVMAFGISASAASGETETGRYRFHGITITDGEVDTDYWNTAVRTVENGAVYPAFYDIDGTTATRIVENFADWNIYAAEVETNRNVNSRDYVYLSTGDSFVLDETPVYRVDYDEDEDEREAVEISSLSAGETLIYVTDGDDTVLYAIAPDQSIAAVQALWLQISEDQKTDSGVSISEIAETADGWTVTLSGTLPDAFDAVVYCSGEAAEASVSDTAITIAGTAPADGDVIAIVDAGGVYRSLYEIYEEAAEAA